MRNIGRRAAPALALAAAVGLSLFGGSIFQAQSPFPGQNPPPKSFEPLPLLPPLPIPKSETAQNLIYRLPQGWAFPRWPEWFKFPRLFPPLDLFPPSGYIPGKCAPVAATPAIVDCWLRNHPHVATHIRWEFGDAPGSAPSWELWSEKRKQQLRDAFDAARQWRAGGFAGWPGMAVADPPENHEAPHLGPEDVRTVYSSEDAWEIYLSHVAVTLASEIDAWVPWSIRFHGPEPLRDLLDGTFRQFVYDRNDGSYLDSVYSGHQVVGSVAPSHAAVAYRFLHDNHLIDASPRKTIARVIDWSRRMLHQVALEGRPLLQGQQDRWHYTGLAPVSRIIGGTLISADYLPGITEPVHMTPGCYGTSDLYVSLFRVVNIPVRRVYSAATCGHISPYWSAEGLYLTHGDDPYGRVFSTMLDAPASSLPIGEGTWNRLFPADATTCPNVGRRVLDLSLTYTSAYLVDLYCQDQRAGRDHASGLVYGEFSSIFTLGELEARGLYDRLAAAAESSTAESCVAWRGSRAP